MTPITVRYPPYVTTTSLNKRILGGFKMKKTWSILLSSLLVLTLLSPIVSADGKPANTPNSENKDKAPSVTENVYEDKDKEDSEEEVAKGKENAKKGLEIALKNAQGTPAAAVLEALINEEDVSLAAQSIKDLVLSDEESSSTTEEDLTDEDLTDEQKNAVKEMAKALKNEIKLAVKTSDVEALKQHIQSLKDLTNALDELQDEEEALDAAETVVSLEPANLENYKNLGQLYKALGEEGIKAFVNGKQPKFDVAPVVKEGRTLIPIRAMVEALDAEVAWDSKTGTVTVTRNGVKVTLTVDDNKATVNGSTITLDVPATVINGRVVIPLRFLSEALGTNVVYDAENQIIVVVEEEATQESTTN
jgi:hypothetical protein